MSDWWSADPVAGGAQLERPAPRYDEAISSVESGGRYDALGPVTHTGDRAYGKYQVMGANVGPWTREVLGRELTPQEFVSSPSAQDAVFKAKFGRYVQKYGPQGAARAWFAGEGGMNEPGRRDILGTSVADYENKFTRALGYTPEAAQKFPPAKNETKADWWSNDPAADEQFPAPPPGVIIHNAGGTSTVAGTNISAKRPDGGGERETAAAMEALKQRASPKAMTPLERGLLPVFQGLTANFGDEAVSAAAAAIQKMRGGSFDDAYAIAQEIQKQELAREQSENPVRSVAGEIAGAVALPVGGVLNAATLPARMGRSAAVGATYGAVSGAGQGEGLTDRASRAATGAVLGGVVGGAAPPIVEGVIQGGAAVARPIVTAMRGAINPESEAARRVVGAVQRDFRVDPTAEGRLSPGEFAASAQQGGPATIMDIGGETTRGLARSAANTSPEGRFTLNQAINERYEGQGNRVVNWLNDTFNFPNAQARQKALEQTQKATNRAAYARAYRDGSGGIWSPELERLAGSDAVSNAMQSAAKSAKDEAIVGGYGAMNPRITFTPDGRIQFNRGPNGVPTYPDLQYWDLVRRELSDAAKRAGYGTSEARRLNNFATAMNAELDRLVPSYAQARAGAAHFFGAENALEAGQNFVTAKLSNAETHRALTQMNPTERKLFQDGFVSRFIETLNATGDRRNVLNQIANSAEARDKLRIVLGPQRAAELEAGLRVEGIMDLARGAVQGNSTTARQLAELGFAGGAGSLGAYGAYNMDPAQMTYAAVAGALLAGKRGIDQRVAKRVAEMLVSNDPKMILRGIKLVSRNGRFMDALRVADRKIAASGAQQTSVGLPAVQSMGIGRADSDQPEIPRPPSQ